MSGGPATANIKIALIFAALVIAGGTLYYTHTIAQKLQARERQIVQLYANTLEYIANSEETTDLTFLLENIIQPIDFEVILTDANDNVDLAGASNFRNVKLDPSLKGEKLKEYFKDKLISMDDVNSPIIVKHVLGTDTLVLNKIHFGESALVTQLKYYPFVQMVITFLFVITAYIGFSQIKKSEQSNIWVGMAKETAHQFGTPLTSLLGWIELLKLNYKDPDKVLDTAEEIQTRAREYLEKIEAEQDARRRELGVQDELRELPGITTAMMVTLGEDGVKTVEDFAGYAVDDLVGWKERKDGETKLFPGVLAEHGVSRADAEQMVLAARLKAGWITEEEADVEAAHAEAAGE